MTELGRRPSQEGTESFRVADLRRRAIASTNCRAVRTPVDAAFRCGRVGFMARRYTDAYRASQRRGSAFAPRPPQSPS